jgi:polar amino acid transport system substrate-binding protein
MKGLVCGLVMSLSVLTATMGTGAAQEAGKCEPDKLKDKYPGLVGKTVNVGLSSQARPFTYPDLNDPNKIIGIDIELMTDTFNCVGVAWKMNIGMWAGLIASVTEGRNDVMWDTLNYTPARAEQVNYALYLSAATDFLVHKGNPKHVTSLDSMCGLNAAAGLGTVEEAAFHDLGNKCVNAGKPDISLSTFTDPTQGNREIINGRVDVIMTDLAQSHIIVSDQPDIELAFHILSGFHVGVAGVAVNKGETELLKAIAEGLKIEQASGKEKAILVKYNVDPSLEHPTEIKTQ